MNERTGGGGAADERTIDRQTDRQKPNGQEMIDNEVGGDGDESVRKGGEGAEGGKPFCQIDAMTLGECFLQCKKTSPKCRMRSVMLQL